MPRKSGVWFRKQDGFHYTTLRGKKIKLSKDKAEAEKAFHTLLAHDIEPDHEAHLRPSMKRVADDFLAQSKEANSDSAFQSHLRYLKSFCEHVGTRKAPDVRGEHITTWLKKHPQWGPSTRSLAVQAVKAALNYAKLEGKLAVHPLKDVKQGAMKQRERILTQEERDKIRERVKGTGFGDLIFFMEQTGARPISEAASVTADMIDWKEGAVTFAKHKNARHGKKRVVYCTPPLLARLKELADKHPAGLLIRNRYGAKFDRQSCHKWMAIFDRELGIKGCTAYAFRTSYATDAIARGVPLPMLAELMGTSVKILLKNYSKVSQKKDELKAAARMAVDVDSRKGA